MDINQKYWVLIQHFVSGNADDEERRILNEWMEQDPENRRFVQELKDIWDLTPPEEFDVDVQVAWMKFRKRQNTTSGRDIQKVGYTFSKASKKPLYLLRVAAVILVSVLAGVFMQYTLSNSNETGQVSEFYVMQTFETAKGEKASVTFSDGSKVMLNSASSIRFPQEFKGTSREVYLEGEAYFEIAHDPDHPFIVYAQDVEVQVLGTKFNVQGWSEDTSVDVAVREGKVAVGSRNEVANQKNQVVLTEGLFTSVEKGGEPSSPQKISINDHLLWTHGGLHFDNVPFRKAIRDIERRFNVQVSGIPEEIKDVPFTGTFQYADLDEVLSVIGAAMNIEYTRDGMNIYLE